MKLNSITATLAIALGLATGYGIGALRSPVEIEPPAHEERIVTALNAPLKLSEGVRRAQALETLRLVASIENIHDPDLIREHLEQSHTLSDPSLAQGILLNNWLATAPNAAIQWCALNAELLLDDLCQSWAELDLDAARTAVAMAPETYAPQLACAVIAQLTTTNATEALACLADFASKILPRPHHLADAVDQISKTADPNAILALSDRVNYDLRTKLIKAAAKAMAKADLNSAIAWWREQPDRKMLAADMFADTPHDRLPETIEFFFNATPPIFPHDFVFEWIRKDPIALADVLIERSAHDQLRNFFAKWENNYPAAAAEWAATITDPEIKAATTPSLSRRERRESWVPATTANGFVTDSGNDHYSLARLSAEERTRLPQALADATPVQAQSALARIFSGSSIPFAEAPALFAAVPIDDENRGWITDELRNLAFRARDFPPDTANWSQEFPPGQLRDIATTEAAKIWNDYDPPAARAWAQSLSDLSARAAAMAMIGDAE